MGLEEGCRMHNPLESDNTTMVAKKYKLFSSSGEGECGKPSPCAFFSSPAGCRNGEKCKFLHVLPSTPSTPVEEASSSSAMSSESEGEIFPVSIAPIASSASMGQEVGSKKKSKAKKRKKSDAADDIFAAPKKQSVVKTVTSAQSSVKKQKKSPQESPRPQQVEAPRVSFASVAEALPQSNPALEQQTKQRVSNFRSLNLPVASFSIEGKVLAASPRTSETPAEFRSGQSQRPLPVHTPTGMKWHDAILKTRDHVRYNGSFDFEKMKDSDEEAGRGYTTDWIMAQKFGDWCAENPQAIAIDCEMCETKDPVSGAVDSKALCRLSVVNAENSDEVLLDTLVKPAWPVVDYRSRINGIREEHLANVQFTLRHAQVFLMALCSDETVIVGHALHNDLAALKMEHHCLVDSSLLFPVKDAPNATPSLKDLVLSVLKKEMPQTHDSVNDARASLLCLEDFLAKKGKVAPIERTPSRNAIAASQLFVHRIPKMCQSAHLMNMFVAHTGVYPEEIGEIEFSGDTGKSHVTFRSSRHANLSFDTLEGKEEADKSGRMQKKVYLKNGGYVRVRKMVHPRGPPKNESAETKTSG